MASWVMGRQICRGREGKEANVVNGMWLVWVGGLGGIQGIVERSVVDEAVVTEGY